MDQDGTKEIARAIQNGLEAVADAIPFNTWPEWVTEERYLYLVREVHDVTDALIAIAKGLESIAASIRVAG